MPDIILNGRNGKGDLVDNVYEGITVLTVKDVNGKDTEFNYMSFGGAKAYVVEAVTINGDSQLKIIKQAGLMMGTKGIYAAITDAEFDQYKQYFDGEASGGDPYYRLTYIITQKPVKVGESYTIGYFLGFED